MNHLELQRFIFLSLESTSSAAIPYVLAAYREPQALLRLDNDLDASTLCHVARRASVAQDRALMGVWDRSFATNVCCRTFLLGFSMVRIFPWSKGQNRNFHMEKHANLIYSIGT